MGDRYLRNRRMKERGPAYLELMRERAGDSVGSSKASLSRKCPASASGTPSTGIGSVMTGVCSPATFNRAALSRFLTLANVDKCRR